MAFGCHIKTKDKRCSYDLCQRCVIKMSEGVGSPKNLEGYFQFLFLQQLYQLYQNKVEDNFHLILLLDLLVYYLFFQKLSLSIRF